MPRTTRTPAQRTVSAKSHIAYTTGCEPERSNLLPDIMARITVPHEDASISADYTIGSVGDDDVYLNLWIDRADGTTLEVTSDHNQVRPSELRGLAAALAKLADEVEQRFPPLLTERQRLAETLRRYGAPIASDESVFAMSE